MNFFLGGGKMGNNFFLKQIFLGGNFRDQVLEASKNILEEFLK